MTDHLINHVAFVIDASGSMSGRTAEVEKVFTNLVAYLKERSVQLDQETRASIYYFNNSATCRIFDQDVMRVKPLSDYRATGGTALLDATQLAIKEMRMLPEIHGNHAFLTYILTDGEENVSKSTAADLTRTIGALPDNWTVAVMVPNSNGVFEAKKFGFPAGNIEQWNTTDTRSVEVAGNRIRAVVDNYMQARATGVRGTKTLFQTDLSSITKTEVRNNLNKVAANLYTIRQAKKKSQISAFVAFYNGNYQLGRSYYELIKPELVQGGKEILIQDRNTGEVFTGARAILGLPTSNVKVKPGDHGNWRILIQSTSVNRNVMPNQHILTMV